MAGVPSLIDLCTAAVAEALVIGVVGGPLDEQVPEPELGLRIWKIYKMRAGSASVRGTIRPQRRLQGVQAFVGYWQPEVLRLAGVVLPPSYGPQPWSALGLLASRLHHVSIALPDMRDLSWVRSVPRLTCLSLRGCSVVDSAALAALTGCSSTLRALDLSGLAQVGDEAGPLLAQLPHLVALDLSHTAAGDAAVEAITYGARLRAWGCAHGRPLPPEGERWPASRIRRWQLASSNVTGAAAELLLGLDELEFLDMRGSGVRAMQLQPLCQRFSLHVVQGAVLSRSAALAAAAVPYGLFVCDCAQQQAQQQQALLAQQAEADAWVLEGVKQLLDATNTVWLVQQHKEQQQQQKLLQRQQQQQCQQQQ